MIRHFKWHKKRDESLQHGFMRYSPMDDCSDRYRGCSHNRKQTHYHCIKMSPKKRKAWKSGDMMKAISASRKKEMGLLKASKTFNVPKSTIKDKARSEEVS
uniref:HTH psq-type domain-containing protein n=1 Tax=Timema genevievae TaxID=629358 RepID=A0A7R9JR64_TIMGE|nr:unnamed protein product [Timema genevievae]